MLLWLQGGMEHSLVFGLFMEHGPWTVKKDLTLRPRDYAWTDSYSVLYLDNPIGIGYSFTDNRTECYAQNQEQVAQTLYTFLTSFFQTFDNQKNNPFYIFGKQNLFKKKFSFNFDFFYSSR